MNYQISATICILPFEQLIINTHLTPLQVIEELKLFVETDRSFRDLFKRPTKPYNGKIQGDSFTMTRNINYRNSFLPVITGKIKANYQGGSEIKITLSLHLFVIIFMCFWMSMVGIAGVSFLVMMFNSGKVIAGGFIPLGMFVFGYLLTIISFNIEANIAKKFLYELWT